MDLNSLFINQDAASKMRTLINYGSKVEVDKLISPKLYFRSGREMLRMANMYCDDDNLECAFILYSKFITLFVEKLPNHPEYKMSPTYDIQDFSRKVKKVFPLAEEIKTKLKDKFVQDEIRQLESKKMQIEQIERERERRMKEVDEQMRQDEAFARKLQSEDDQRLVDQQEKEYRKHQEVEKRRLAIKNKLDGNDINSFSASPSTVSDAVSQYASHCTQNYTDRNLMKMPVMSEPGCSDSIDDIPSIPPPPYTPAIPDRRKKPSMDHFMSTGLFCGDGGLRIIFVPDDVMPKFISAAKHNTSVQTETMGILCGRVSGNSFKITNVVIPNQVGTPDSCDMLNEEDLIVYQEMYHLITLGWIHTHPTQTAFLSSVDMHTHFAYQKMLPEAVAIVCSPKFEENGVFSLTEFGLEIIGRCKEAGFHYHAKQPPLFMPSGHAKIISEQTVVISDLRKLR